MAADQKTADAFAKSWNNLPSGSVYTEDQFEDWISPLGYLDFKGKRVLELGCGNGSQLLHAINWQPSYIEGVDLGESVLSAKSNLAGASFESWKVTQADMTKFDVGDFDTVYSIGVLHHLVKPREGLEAVVRNVKPGGRFHCWVYAEEGNGVVINFVDPLRKLTSKLPWWITKYMVATPLAVPFFLYAKFLKLFCNIDLVKRLPLFEYCIWIERRKFSFFRHVAFDQLVTPQTSYINRQTIQNWLSEDRRIAPESVYIVMRNGNSWKFGGVIKEEAS